MALLDTDVPSVANAADKGVAKVSPPGTPCVSQSRRVRTLMGILHSLFQAWGLRPTEVCGLSLRLLWAVQSFLCFPAV